MRNTRKFLETTILTLGGVLLTLTAAPAQPQKTVFCIADGTQIGVDRFEMKDGKFYLYVQGAAQPLQYPTTSVKGIDVPCTSTSPAPAAATAAAGLAPAAVPAVARFGIAGSNTIGERLMPMLIDAFGAKHLGRRAAVQDHRQGRAGDHAALACWHPGRHQFRRSRVGHCDPGTGRGQSRHRHGFARLERCRDEAHRRALQGADPGRR
jgi:hypothetical protein